MSEITKPKFDVRGLEFFDQASNWQMKYVYPDTDHWSAGWILYKNPGDGQWVTLRKATDADIAVLNKAVMEATHA